MPPFKKEKKAPKNQLIDELAELRQRAAELEVSKETVKKTEETLGDSREIDLEKLMGLKQLALEVHYRALFENNPVETIIVDTEARITGTNLTSSVRGEQEPNIGQIMYKDYAGQYEINMYKELMDCIKNNTAKEFPKQRYKGNFLHIWISPFAGGAIITSIDITDKVLLEGAMRKSQKRARFLAQILDNVSQPLAVSYPDGRIMTYNAAFCDLIDYTKEDLHNVIWLTDLIPPKWHDALTNTAENMLKTGEPQPLQFEYIRKNGSSIPVNVMAYPLMDGKGTPQSYYLFMTPKTEPLPKQTDKISFQTICENAPLMIHGFDLQGNCVFWNKECEKMLGWKKNEVTLLKNLWTMMHPDPNELERVQNNWKKPDKVFHEYLVHTKNNTKRIQSWANFMIPDRIIVSMGNDITQYKLIEEKLYHSTNTIKGINEEIARYDQALTHDLQAQLSAIKNYTTFLLDDSDEGLSDIHKTYIHGLVRAAQEAKEMVEGLIALARVAGPVHPVEEIRMGKFLKELIASLTVPSDVHVTLWENWPNLNAAPALLQQIFLNLIDNAIKFNRATHKLVEIGWRDLDNDQYEFFVRDNGIGIKPRYTEQIFGVFERLHTSEEFRGTGIGLAIVKKAIHLLRGSIRLESTLGEGTTFFVAFSKVQQGI